MLLVCFTLYLDLAFIDILHFSGYGSQTKFDVRVKEQADLLRKALVLYIGVSSDFTGISFCFHQFKAYLTRTESEILLVLSPITTMPRNESHFAGK
jgi:hypothetical protein